MRVGDFSVEVVPHGSGRVRELESGHVLARPGQVYRLRLRNHGPLHTVATVELDGHGITAGGLVLRPWSVTELERPIDAGEHGRFTVIAEGDELVFGPDGGRDNTSLGLIDARFRRELPRHDRVTDHWPAQSLPVHSPSRPPLHFDISAFAPATRVAPHAAPSRVEEAIERAAGTGLTGHSDQEFVPIHLGPLENEATEIQLRIVIGSEETIAEDGPRPLADRDAPARPAARP